MTNRLSFSTILVSIIYVSAFTQQNHLDVEGHTKIRGNIDIHHMDDSTSIFVGTKAGQNIAFGAGVRKLTFMGSEAGRQSMFGNDNSFFGYQAGKVTNGAGNSFFGSGAGSENENGFSNSFFGIGAGRSINSGDENTFIGSGSGFRSTMGSFNTFVGSFSQQLSLLDTLDRAIAIGRNAKVGCSNCAVIGGTGPDSVRVGIGTPVPEQMLDVRGNVQILGRIEMSHHVDTTSLYVGRNAGVKISSPFTQNNTFVGSNAGTKTASSSDNSFFGSGAGRINEVEGNSFFGSNAGFANTTGFENSFFGYQAGGSNVSGQHNAFFGFNAGIGNENGTNNTFIGKAAGASNETGSRNTYVGSGAGLVNGLDSLDRAIALGANARVGCSGCAVIGGTGINAVKVGIGVSDPTTSLDVDGNARFRQVGNLPPFGAPATAVYMYDDGTLVLNSSDLRLKENIEPLTDVLEKLNKIDGYEYNYKSNQNKIREIGVIAQELELAFPALVFTNRQTGYKGVHYERIVAVLLAAIKEQQKDIKVVQAKLTEIDYLKQKNIELEMRLRKIENILEENSIVAISK